MTEAELNKFEKILADRRAELEQIVRNREGIAIEKAQMCSTASRTYCEMSGRLFVVFAMVLLESVSMAKNKSAQSDWLRFHGLCFVFAAKRRRIAIMTMTTNSFTGPSLKLHEIWPEDRRRDGRAPWQGRFPFHRHGPALLSTMRALHKHSQRSRDSP